MTRRVLVTGSDGFVGPHLIKHLNDAGYQVVGFDLRAGLDIRDYETIRGAVETTNPDLIVHLAAQAYVPESSSDVRRGVDINIIGTLNLLEAVRHTGCRARVLLAGTTEEYGYETQPGPVVTEESLPRPTTLYGASKLAAGQLGLTYGRTHGIPVVVTRAGNHVGPGQSAAYAASGFARRVAEVEAELRNVVEHGNLAAIRNYTDVRDIVRAYHVAIDLPSGVYNVVSDQTVPMQTVMDLLVGRAKRPITTQTIDALYRPASPVFHPLSWEKLHTAGWSPQIPLDQSLHDLLEYWREHL